jgi:HK97 gp10 family phage protein
MAAPLAHSTGLVRIEGLKELEANLKILREEFGVKTGGVIIRGLRAGAKLIRDDAKRRVRRVPSSYASGPITRGRGKTRRSVAASSIALAGLLRSNIVEHAIPVKSRLAGGKPTVLVRVRNHGYTRVNGAIRFNRPGSSPGWWWWLEFGTSRHTAQPFLRPAFEAQKAASVEKMKDTIRAEIDKLFAKHTRRAA